MAQVPTATSDHVDLSSPLASSSSPSTMTASLPNELLKPIIQYALESSNDYDNFMTTARSLAAVNKTFANLVREDLHTMAEQLMAPTFAKAGREIDMQRAEADVLRRRVRYNNVAFEPEHGPELELEESPSDEDFLRMIPFIHSLSDLADTLSEKLGGSALLEERERKAQVAYDARFQKQMDRMKFGYESGWGDEA